MKEQIVFYVENLNTVAPEIDSETNETIDTPKQMINVKLEFEKS